ncbi:hypothetical protein PBY51_021409 [Eleginops maclovinus]|uniref:TIR domain-containing protein n=1 Tax=Eleginops maclovinus TaxID=56733 RepID=A0AAN7XFM7_ELEMC|nr:hypothetical protein PBY51_021409 [Eleginops maclovinus]
MSHVGQESQGTGLKDVFDIVIKAPPNRLLSLTFQLGESPEDNIIQALCLLVLKKEERALNKLQMLKNNSLAQLLAEKWQVSEGKLEDFATHCAHLQEFTGEALALLARIFKVLSEQRLCDTSLRNLAYKRALSSDNQKTSNCEYLEYDQFREEAKYICGPQVAEWLCSLKNQKQGSVQDPHDCPDEESTTLKVTLSQDQSERAYSLPSPLQATSLSPSYPTHLEISMPPTASYQENRVTPETSDASKINTFVPRVGESHTSQPDSNEPPTFGAKKPFKMEEAAKGGELDSLITHETKNLHETSKPATALPTATNNFRPKMPAPKEVHESKGAEVEDEPIFYSFVIFHAAEDADMAESMKEKLEKVIDIEGATFSGDFAIPGMSTLRSVEDAINNSAYTVLLLTRNFNNRMQMMETDSALVNSIKKKHKDGTVIPLLPRENSMPKDSLPLVLQTINTLEENRSFDRKLRKVFSPGRIKNQREIWIADQKVKMQMKRQEALKTLNWHQKQLIGECTKAELLQKDNLMLLMQQELHLGPRVPPELQHIHINNAKYIVIGNDSRMNVVSDEHTDRDDSINRDEDCS